LVRTEVRGIQVETLLDVVASGTLLEKGAGHCWIWKGVEGREDDLP